MSGITASFTGKVGADAEVRSVGDGSVVNFNVATEHYDRKAKERVTTWVRVSLWGKQADSLSQYITKGSSVYVTGELTTEEYNGKSQVNVRADRVDPFLGKREGAAGGGANTPAAQQPAMADLDDDVPF